MKKQLLNKCALVATFLIGLLSLSSCENDAEEFFIGRWEVVEVEAYNGQCPYAEGDIFYFGANNRFYSEGNGLNESGSWYVAGGGGDNVLHIRFDGYNYDAFHAYVASLNGNYIKLDVTDDAYGSRYTLRLVYVDDNDGSYYSKKQ